MISYNSAIEVLLEGNKRFMNGELFSKNLSHELRLGLFENGQNPIAVVLTCSDSRVSPELIFDQGLGDIFVIRNAGNVVDNIEIASIEYAIKHLNVKLVIVLGHEKCGAVKAAIEGESITPHINSIIDNIIPCVDRVKINGGYIDMDEIASRVEDENIKESTNRLLRSSIVKQFVEEEKIKLVPAKYSLETGKVEFLE